MHSSRLPGPIENWSGFCVQWRHPPPSTRLVARHPCNATMDGRPLCLDSDYECPRPCPPLLRCDSSESEGTRSRSASPVSSGLPTTSTAESYDVAAELMGKAVIRCKSIKPLAIIKRAVSPVPPPPQPVASSSTLQQQMNDEYYAAHAGSFITLAPPLPPSFPASPSCELLPMSAALPSSRALRRESAIIPPSVSMASTKRASVRRTPAVWASIPIPTRAPPPPPIVTWHSHSHSYSLAVGPSPNTASASASYYLSPASAPASRPSPALSRSRTRAPPKMPLPTDALSTPWSGDWTAHAPYGTPSPSSSQQSYGSSERLAALLSPSPATSSPQRQRRFPAETQGVPFDVSSEWEEEEDARNGAPRPCPSRSNPAFASTRAASAPIAGPGRYTGWHPRPRASQLRLALAVEPFPFLHPIPPVPPRPPLLPTAQPKPKPMASANVLSMPKRKGKGGKRLTVEGVFVISPAPAPPAPAPTPAPTCGANAPRQRWSYSSHASSSRSRASPSGSGSESESDSGHSDSDCGSAASAGSAGSEGMRRKPIPCVSPIALNFSYWSTSIALAGSPFVAVSATGSLPSPMDSVSDHQKVGIMLASGGSLGSIQRDEFWNERKKSKAV
ncbi:hypothetical protein B0H14DRAFT_3896249 [Mycena olivaceomarginata]|nr:hypothetical protein B0H14DRAFT_3896249 [Mycena olivaceomarginata]